MGIMCCSRADDQNQLDDGNTKIQFPVNQYIRHSVVVPENCSIPEEAVISRPKNIPSSAIHCRVYACYEENVFPIWIEVGVNIEFIVVGNWYLFNGEKMVGCEGDDENVLIMNHQLGSLLGHIQGGPLFQIYSGLKYQSRKAGCLMMLQNNGGYETNPFGYLDVYVLGAKLYRWNEIERLSGWNMNIVDTTRSFSFVGQKERDLLILINKLRQNPAKFADQYLSHYSGSNVFYDEAFKFLSQLSLAQSNGFTSIHSMDIIDKCLKPELNLFKLAEKQGNDLNATGNTGHISTEGLTLVERLHSVNINSECFSEICSFGKSCPIGILLQLLVDDDDIDNFQNRETLVNGNYSHVGISVQLHKTYGYSCIITLVKL